MRIPISQPIDLASSLESGQAFRWVRLDRAPGTSTEDGQEVGPWFRGVLFNNVVQVRHVDGGIEFESTPDSGSTVEPLLRDYLRLDDDLDTIYRSVNRDERIVEAVARYRGLRLLRQDPWECLVSFICSANSNIPRISGNVEDMARHFGRPIECGNEVRHAFPGPEELMEAGETRLRELRLGFHAKYVAAVAEIVSNGDVDLFALREAPYEDALYILTQLPGVADKVANCALLFSLDKLEAFPVDVWIHRVLEEWYPVNKARDKKASRIDMRLWAQDYFGAYAGYANQYLFHRRRLQGKT